MKTTPHLLDQLVNLTSIRDAELLEFSLLRTIHELFLPSELALLRLAADGTPLYQMAIHDDGPPRVSTDNIRIDPETLLLAREAASTHSAQSRELARGRLESVYPVLERRGLTTILRMEIAAELSAEGERLVQGFVKFFQNYCSLLDDSQRDQLTGLLNRKTFDDSVFKLFSQGDRAVQLDPLPPGQSERRQPAVGQVWMAMIDIDHFKRVNDTFGHLYGDEVLLLMAQLMRRCFREGDLLFRFGGEEFVAIARSANKDGARIAFERFRQRVASQTFPQVGTVTVSIGVVELVPGQLTSMLLDQADRALYYCKMQGRNRFAIYEELVASGELVEQVAVTGDVDLF